MPAAQPQLTQKFKVEKSTTGPITLLTLHGVLDEAFEGKATATTVKTKAVVVSLADVRRFASWGMSEWMNFLRATADRDLYLVECSTYAVNQMNLVTGLLGHAKLVSFYSPYRCGGCSEEFEKLTLVPNDRTAIRDLPDSQQLCATCGGNARMEKYPAAMFAVLAERPLFDMDDAVLSYLRSEFRYDLVPDATRFRAYRQLAKGYTYLRLSGNMGTLPPDLLKASSEGTTVVDLANVVYDPEQLTNWRSYIKSTLPAVTSVQLLDCPPGFFETAVQSEDLKTKLKVRTFAAYYQCPSCSTTTAGLIDVASNLEQLIEGVVPSAQCPACSTLMVAAVAPEQVMRLPAREHDAALDKFLAKARTEPLSKLEDCLVARAAPKPPAPRGVGRAIYIGSAVTVIVVGALVVAAMSLWNQHSTQEPVAIGSNPGQVVAPKPPPTFQRPDWILSDVPSSAFCHDVINRMVCIGVSSYRATRGEGVTEANDAALEELVNTIGLKISNPFFHDNVLSTYSDARAKALSALQAVDTDRTSAAYAAADDVVLKARKRVVEILHASGGAAVPAQRSDWYWEEYAREKGGGTEVLVFVRYDVSLDALKALVEKYSAATQVSGNTTMTAFPALAWRYPDFTGGAMLTTVSRPFATGGVTPQSIVMAIGDQRVVDAISFAKHVEAWTSGALKLTVKTGEVPPRAVTVHR